MAGPERKRYRMFKAKPGQLLARFGRADPWDSPDLCYAWGNRDIKPDSRVLMSAFEEVPVFEGRTLRQELEARGYDITTLRFSVERKPEASPSSNPIPHGKRDGGGMTALGHFERRVLAYLDQRGPTHRHKVVWDLASPESKIGRARDTGSAVGGGSSSNAEALIMGAWCRRLIRLGLVRQRTSEAGFYLRHEITPDGRKALRAAPEPATQHERTSR